MLVRGGEDGVDHSLTPVEYDRGSSGKSTSTTSQAGGKATGDLAYSSVVRPVLGDCRRPDTEASERSIYDNAPEHCYANVEKDETGRLLNRDTLAFRMSDYETVNPSVSNGQDGPSHLIDTSSALHVDRRGEVPVVVHRTNKAVDVSRTNSFNHSVMADRNQSNATTTEQVPYHTGRSTFYQRMDSGEGILSCARSHFFG